MTNMKLDPSDFTHVGKNLKAAGELKDQVCPIGKMPLED